MPFTEISDNLEVLSEISSTNDKEGFLKVCFDNALFEKTVKYALSQGWTYNVNNIPLHPDPFKLEHADELFEFLDYLREKGSASDKDKDQLSRLSSGSESTLHVANRIVSKDLKCGVGIKTVSNIKSDAIDLVPYQRCSGESKLKNIQFPALVQKKADSMFSYAFPWKSTGTFLTRGGMFYDVNNNVLNYELNGLIDGQEVLVGEAQVLDKNYDDVLPRKVGNGILNSIIQGGGTQDEMDRVIYDVWDIIPYEAYLEKMYKSNIITRFKRLCKRSEQIRGDAVQVIPYRYVDSIEEARIFYWEMRGAGFEGAILKNFADHWKFNTSTKQIKLKNQSVAEFIIIDAYEGKKGKKYEGILGGITVQSSCGGIVGNCGGGFSKKERELGVDWWLAQKGKIVSILFESVISDKTERKTMKLYSPQFDEIRHDKMEADTLEYCVDISTGKKIITGK